MSGQPADGKTHTLKVGDPCIIEVDRVNSPEGLWWGQVTEVGGRDNPWHVRAVIVNGRFAHRDNVAVHSDEKKGVEPSVNYWVYPNTPAVCRLVQVIEILRNEVRLGQDRFRLFRDDTAAMLGQAIQTSQAPSPK